MAFNINAFKQNALKGGGARPTLFEVTIDNPVAIVDARFFVQATSVPASKVQAIDVPYFGRKVRVAGDRTFDDWRVTCINDENFRLRNSMESWMNLLNNHEGNYRSLTNPASYSRNATVTQLSQDGGGVLAIYKFFNLFPIDVAEISLDWNADNQIETFDVTFTYDYWEHLGVTNIGTTNAGTLLKFSSDPLPPITGPAARGA